MYQSQTMDPYASGSGKIVAHASLRPRMGPAYGPSPGPVIGATIMDAPNASLATPGSGYNNPPASLNGTEPVTLHGIDVETLLRDCGFVKPNSNQPVPVTVLDMTRPPGENIVPLTVNPGMTSIPARYNNGTNTGYGNMSGLYGGGMMPHQERGGASPFGVQTGTQFANGGAMAQHQNFATNMNNNYANSNYFNSGGAAPLRREMSPMSFRGAYDTVPPNAGRYTFPGTGRVPEVGRADYRTYSNYGTGMTAGITGKDAPFHSQYGGRTYPPDAGVVPWPRGGARSRRSISRVPSPVPQGPVMGGLSRRSIMVPNGTDRLMQATITRRSPSPPPGRSPSPVSDYGGMTRVDGRSPSPVPRRSVVSAHGPGMSAAIRPSRREQVMAREALSEAHDMLATVRREIDNRNDFKQKVRPHELERFKTALFQLERALETQTQPRRRCRSPPLQQ